MNEQCKKITNKKKILIGMVALCLVLLSIGKLFHTNNVSNLQVIQSFTGETSVRTQGGIYFKFWPKIWPYEKTRQVAFSYVKAESDDNDGVTVRFANKGEGYISIQITYSLVPEEDKILKMHELTKGDDDIIDKKIIAIIRDSMMVHAGKITSSESIEKRDEFVNEVRQDIVHCPKMMEIGVDITEMFVTYFDWDERTHQAYQKAQEADLQKKTAEAEKLNLIMQKERVEAEADMKIAMSKGNAEIEKVKAITDAQRQKELAEIKGQQEVMVAELAKKKATVEANRQLEVMEITKKEETAKLEVIRIQANQQIAEAEAKRKRIELAGDITEKERFYLEVQAKKETDIAKAIASGIQNWQLPKVMMIGGSANNNAGTGTIDSLLKLLVVSKANELAKDPSFQNK